MAYTNLEALNELIQKIKAGEGTAKSNLEALNMLCVIAGGTGTAKSNLEALNELLTVFKPGGETQEKSVTIIENGTTEITPDEGYTLSKAVVVTDVPPKPEQSKAVTITENGTTEITPDDGYVLSRASVTVNIAPPVATVPYINTNEVKGINANITKIDLGNVIWLPSKISSLESLFKDMTSLSTINWNGIKAVFENSVYASNMFYGCKSIQEIDISSLSIVFITSVNSMFQDCTNLKRINWGNIKVRTNTFAYMFYKCTSLKTLNASFIDPEYTQTSALAYMFAQCTSLEFVDLSNLKTEKVNGLSMVFSKCTSLKNIVFEHGCFSNTVLKEVPLSDCPLSHDCAVDIFNKLATRSNSPTLKLSATTKGYLTNEEIAIATEKGWVIS